MLERHNVFHFDEPIPYTDLEGMAQVAAALDIPVAIGERQHTRFDFKGILVKNAGDILQPGVTKCGGLSEAKKIAALADAFGKYAPPTPLPSASASPPTSTSGPAPSPAATPKNSTSSPPATAPRSSRLR